VANARLIAVAGVAGVCGEGGSWRKSTAAAHCTPRFLLSRHTIHLLDARARGSHPRREKKRALAALAAIVAPVSAVSITRDLVVTSVGAFSFVFLLFKFLLTDPRVETSLSRKRATATNEGQFTGGGWGAPAHSLVDPLTTAVTGRHSRGTRVPIVRQRARVARK